MGAGYRGRRTAACDQRRVRVSEKAASELIGAHHCPRGPGQVNSRHQRDQRNRLVRSDHPPSADDDSGPVAIAHAVAGNVGMERVIDLRP
jgi:hypothetical protein